jgi:hypothetical protein
VGGAILVILLLGGVFLQARLLYPVIFLPRSYEAERIADVNLPTRMVSVLRSEGDPRLTVKTPLDDRRADASDREQLDRNLFPGEPPHAYLLLVASAGDEGSAVLDFGPDGLILEDGEGRTLEPVALHEVVRKRAAALPSSLHLSLRQLVPEPGPILIDPGETCRMLLAYPAEADLATIRSGRLGDRVFKPVEVRKDDLDHEIAGDSPRETAGSSPSPGGR